MTSISTIATTIVALTASDVREAKVAKRPSKFEALERKLMSRPQQQALIGIVRVHA
jgi:hypothetical protein